MSCQCNTMLCRIYLYPITSLVKISATTLIIFISRYNGPKMQWCTYLLCYNGIGPCNAYPKYEGMIINSYLIRLRKLSIEIYYKGWVLKLAIKTYRIRLFRDESS